MFLHRQVGCLMFLPGMHGAVLAQIGKLNSLTHLDLSALLIADVDLEDLINLKQLEVLSLEATRVTDDGLAILSRLSNLKKLNVHQTEVTADGIQKLRRAIPGMSIIVDDNEATPL